MLRALRDLRHRRHLQRRSVLAAAPYPLSRYRDFLVRAKAARRVRLLSFNDNPAGTDGRARFYVRHDVDMAGCVANLALLLAVDVELEAPAAVFVRVDGEDYDPALCRAAVEEFRPAGVSFGLHTACYTHDDPFAVFERELGAFESFFGFPPDSFTIHGLGEIAMDRRLRFCDEVLSRMSTYGLRASDCHPRLRSYRHIVQDCNVDPRTAPARCMYEDYETVAPFLLPDANYLLLTHPCYWRP